MAIQYNDLYLNIRQKLLEREEPSASMVARELVCAASGKSREKLVADYGIYVSDDIEKRAMEYLDRRLRDEPLAYIIGQWDFYGLTLAVTPDVLIPREDSQIAVDLAIEAAKELGDTPRILDLCAGSGCIGLAMMSKLHNARLTFADISEGAVSVCKENIKKYNFTGRASCLKADAKMPAPSFMGLFDVIVSNPPYVTKDEMGKLEPPVKNYEPEAALYGGVDGLDFYRAIAKNWKSALKNEGRLVFECGISQSEKVCAICEDSGYEILEVRKDTQGIDRAILARPIFQ